MKTKNMKRLPLTIFALVIIAATARLSATTYDAFNDFSITNGNPNGVWSYGWSTTLLLSLNLYPNGTVDPNGNLSWNDPNHISAGAPAVFANKTDQQPVSVPPMSAGFHPGENGEFSHYVWTAPTTGLFSLSALFSPFDSGGTDVHILDNGVSIFSGEVSPGNPQSYTGNLSATVGDKIDFAVGVGTDGTYNFDTTGIDATIQSVPEASTWIAALGAAAVMFVGYSRRRWLSRQCRDPDSDRNRNV
jgi:hypothetical protein